MMSLERVLRGLACGPWPSLFAVAGVGYVVSALSGLHTGIPALCTTESGLAMGARLPFAMKAVFAFDPPIRILTGWIFMLVAMMPPLLAMPIMHVWRSSRRQKRVHALAFFLLGYCLMWLVAGPVMICLALLFQLIAAKGAFIGSLIIATLWSASPWHRTALNCGHRVNRIGIFGWAVSRDSLKFGMTHGIWCVISCWAWMLVPLVSGAWHAPIMFFVGVIMLIERIKASGRSCWHWPVIFPLPYLLSILAARSAKGSYG